MKARKILEQAASRLDLPGEAVGLPRMEIDGFTRLSVEQHRGVLEYTGEAVTISLADGRVRVTGSRLTITVMNRSFLTLTGELRGIELIPEGRP